MFFWSCTNSLPIKYNDVAGTWYTDSGISRSNLNKETFWLFRGWDFVSTTNELDKYGNFKSEALSYRNDYDGVVVKRIEKNGVRVGNPYLGIWEFDGDYSKSNLNIIWLVSERNKKPYKDNVHFSLDNKGVVNLVHGESTFRQSGESRTMLETILIFTVVGSVIGGLIGGLFSYKKGKLSKNKDDKNKQLSKENKLPLKTSEKDEKKDKFILKKDEFLDSNKNRE